MCHTDMTSRSFVVLVCAFLFSAVVAVDVGTAVLGSDMLPAAVVRPDNGPLIYAGLVHVGVPGSSHYMTLGFSGAPSGIASLHTPSDPGTSTSFVILRNSVADVLVAGSRLTSVELEPGVGAHEACLFCSGHLDLGASSPLWLQGAALVTSHGIFFSDLSRLNIDVPGAARAACVVGTPERCIATAEIGGVSYEADVLPSQPFTLLPALVYDMWIAGLPRGGAASPANIPALEFRIAGATVRIGAELFVDNAVASKIAIKRKTAADPHPDRIEFGWHLLSAAHVHYDPALHSVAVFPASQQMDYSTKALVLMFVYMLLFLRVYFGPDLSSGLLFDVEKGAAHGRGGRAPTAGVVFSFTLDAITMAAPLLAFTVDVGRAWDVHPLPMAMHSTLVGVFALMYALFAMAVVTGFFAMPGFFVYNETGLGAAQVGVQRGAHTRGRLSPVLARRGLVRATVIKSGFGGILVATAFAYVAHETAQATLGTFISFACGTAYCLVGGHTLMLLFLYIRGAPVVYRVHALLFALLFAMGLLSTGTMVFIPAVNWVTARRSALNALSVFSGIVVLIVAPLVFMANRVDRDTDFINTGRRIPTQSSAAHKTPSINNKAI